MAKKHGWRGLSVLAWASLFLCVGCMRSKPVAFASKTSPNGEWSVTLWKEPAYKAWAEVHGSTLGRTERVDVGWFDDWREPDWECSKIIIDNDTAILGSPRSYETYGESSDLWIRTRIVRREVFREKSPPAPRYSGQFEVVSDFPETIQIVSWSDEFGRARPPKGAIAPRKAFGSDYLWLKEVPDSISVEWYPESDPDHHRRQTIFMVGVVPVDQKGRTAFHLDREGEWSVRFVPAD